MTLPRPASDLLMHHLDNAGMDPGIVVIRHPRGTGWGVAFVVDGWYSAPGLAEATAGFWADLLTDTIHALQHPEEENR